MESSEKTVCGMQTQLRLAAPFCDGAVFQRDMPVPVWGKAAPRKLVRCTLGGVSAMAVSDAEGKFRCYLPEITEADRGLTLIVEEVESGRKISVENIAVGDVYLCSGQSNMAFLAKDTPDWEEFSKAPADPDIRFFNIKAEVYPGIQSDVTGYWEVDSVAASENFSAIGYYFAKYLRKLDPAVPVGIINASLGGMPIETFISREALLKCPVKGIAEQVRAVDKINSDPEFYAVLPEGELVPSADKRMFALIDEKFPFEHPVLSKEAEKWHLSEFDDSMWQNILLPDSWTVAGYCHAGVFWFRKSVDIPEEWAGKDLTLAIGAADKCDETFFNGEKIGSTGSFRRFDHFIAPRVYTVPGKLVKAGKSVISVRVSSAVSIATDGGLTGPAAVMKLSCGDENITLAGMWKMKMEHNYGTWGAKFMTSIGGDSAQSVHMLFDNMIHPLIPYAMRGAVWYQGEYNALAQADVYKEMLLTLIDDWQMRWGQDKFDFVIIQLPGFQPVREYQHFSQWAVLREEQRLAALTSGNSLIVTVRDGDVDDLHPRGKRPVAERAAAAAFYNMYHPEKLQSPMPSGCVKNDCSLIVTFDKDIAVKDEKIRTLMLSADGTNFFPAEGIIENGRNLRISSAQVSEPEVVRYAWSNNPELANLTSGDDGSFISPFEISCGVKLR